MTTQKKRLFSGSNSAILKPQNRFSDVVKNKAKKQISVWLMEYQIDTYHASLLASELIRRVILQLIASTSENAPDILYSDGDKIETLFRESRKLADKLDEEVGLGDLIDELVIEDSRKEGNSI